MRQRRHVEHAGRRRAPSPLWGPCDAFPITDSYLNAFRIAWDRQPACRVCCRALRAGDLGLWTGPAPRGLAHLHCAVRAGLHRTLRSDVA